ncbi:MAG: arabinan endo-1,5-alpha-L-arabinosidase, partial [Planctomycetaceae bacterium]|nr:arabinan endo-1,5-alpha-L-arabinosidase [Planctomycetaceae bacterium]
MIRNLLKSTLFFALSLIGLNIAQAENPIFPGWYADPEVIIYGDTYWIYPTYSAPFNDQTFFDAFSSKDLVNWTKHEKILTTKEVTWARRAMWAPSVLQ